MSKRGLSFRLLLPILILISISCGTANALTTGTLDLRQYLFMGTPKTHTIQGTASSGLFQVTTLQVGGAYSGGSGATISSAGVGQFNGALTTDAALTALSAEIGGAYSGGSGATISAAGVGQFNGALTTDGTLTSSAVEVGGAYSGGSGATISTAGVGQFNGALTTDGNLVALSVDIGGGSGGTGATITSAGAATFDSTLTATGAFRASVLSTVVDATDTVTLTMATHGGKYVLLTHADTVAVTLPANGAAVGSVIYVALCGDDSLAVTISAATADTLIGVNDAGLDSVTYGAGQRIGAMAMFWSDGTYWHVQNMSDCTLTYTS